MFFNQIQAKVVKITKIDRFILLPIFESLIMQPCERLHIDGAGGMNKLSGQNKGVVQMTTKLNDSYQMKVST